MRNLDHRLKRFEQRHLPEVSAGLSSAAEQLAIKLLGPNAAEIMAAHAGVKLSDEQEAQVAALVAATQARAAETRARMLEARRYGR